MGGGGCHSPGCTKRPPTKGLESGICEKILTVFKLDKRKVVLAMKMGEENRGSHGTQYTAHSTQHTVQNTQHGTQYTAHIAQDAVPAQNTHYTHAGENKPEMHFGG